MRSTKLFKTVASFALVAAMVAPLLLSSAPTADAAMKFSVKKANLAVGQTKKVKIKGFKKGSSARWLTTSSKIASVKGNGKKATITGVGGGTAKITCRVGTTTIGGLTVKVHVKVNSLSLSGSSSSVDPGKSITVEAKINGKNDKATIANQSITWKANNANVKVKKSGSNKAKVTGVKSGDATITATCDGKTATFKVKVTGSSSSSSKTDSGSKTNAKPKATPWTYSDKSIVYKQHYDVTRWYNPDTTGAINGHKHDGYKNNNFAIWMVGFFDNKYSTNEEGLNDTYGPNLQELGTGSGSSRKYPELSVSGTFWYEGTKQKTILFQINYTSPTDYPILRKWQDNVKATDNNAISELNIKGTTGSNIPNPKEKESFSLKFTIPGNAKNGDKDEKGRPYGFYVYFPNKPGGALAYVKDNTFHFTDFLIKK